MLSTILLILDGTLVGNEICVSLVNSTLYKLPDECQLRAAKPIDGLFGGIMPFWYFVVFTLSIAERYLARAAGPPIPHLLDASTGLFAQLRRPHHLNPASCGQSHESCPMYHRGDNRALVRYSSHSAKRAAPN